jgi:hypothetical protein
MRVYYRLGRLILTGYTGIRLWPEIASWHIHLGVRLRENRPSNSMSQRRFTTYSVEKLDKNERLFFCRKAKHSEVHTALVMSAYQ